MARKPDEGEQSKLDKKPGLMDRLKSVFRRPENREPQTLLSQKIAEINHSKINNNDIKSDPASEYGTIGRPINNPDPGSEYGTIGRPINNPDPRSQSGVTISQAALGYPDANDRDDFVVEEKTPMKSVGQVAGLTKKNSSERQGADIEESQSNTAATSVRNSGKWVRGVSPSESQVPKNRIS